MFRRRLLLRRAFILLAVAALVAGCRHGAGSQYSEPRQPRESGDGGGGSGGY